MIWQLHICYTPILALTRCLNYTHCGANNPVYSVCNETTLSYDTETSQLNGELLNVWEKALKQVCVKQSMYSTQWRPPSCSFTTIIWWWKTKRGTQTHSARLWALLDLRWKSNLVYAWSKSGKNFIHVTIFISSFYLSQTMTHTHTHKHRVGNTTLLFTTDPYLAGSSQMTLPTCGTSQLT